ncbi:MAG: DUF2878 domain-containing protein [Alcanivorax sp.]|jgi:hypothetical protein|nr:MAG: hypothetical protein COA68_00250 [Oceanobacter sp.]
MLNKIVNAVAFQLCWFACVLGGSLWAAGAVALFLMWHSQVVKIHEWRFIIAGTVAGFSIDSLWYSLGFIQFPNYNLAVIPAWLMLLWLAFNCTLQHSLLTFFQRPWLIALLSAIAAPFSYYAGSVMGAIELSPFGLIAVGLGWGILMGCLSWIFNKYTPAVTVK